jgi:hypothetical protein
MAAKANGKSGTTVLLPALLLAGCLGLGWVVYQQLNASPAPRPVPVATEPAPPLPELPETVPFEMPPADDFASVVERPLFSPSRRAPSEAAAVVAAVAMDPLDLELTGVIASGDRRTAIFKPKPAASVETAGSTKKERREWRERRRKRAKRSKRTPQAAPAVASIQLSEGDDYKGWNLQQIEVDSALFVRGEDETWLEISFDVAAPVQPKRPKKRAEKRDRSDDRDRDATAEERQWIMGVLEGEGCLKADDMELEDGVFLVDEVECDDGRTYEVTLDRDYRIIAKERDD